MIRRASEVGDCQHANARQDFHPLTPADPAAAEAVRQAWAALLLASEPNIPEGASDGCEA
jgi:hypothetical protein